MNVQCNVQTYNSWDMFTHLLIRKKMALFTMTQWLCSDSLKHLTLICHLIFYRMGTFIPQYTLEWEGQNFIVHWSSHEVDTTHNSDARKDTPEGLEIKIEVSSVKGSISSNIKCSYSSSYLSIFDNIIWSNGQQLLLLLLYMCVCIYVFTYASYILIPPYLTIFPTQGGGVRKIVKYGGMSNDRSSDKR